MTTAADASVAVYIVITAVAIVEVVDQKLFQVENLLNITVHANESIPSEGMRHR